MVFLNDGNNGFAVGPTLLNDVHVDEYHGRFRIVDIDDDGLWDIVAGPARYPDVFRADGLGIWVVRQSAPARFDARLYLAADGDLVDGDGDGDLDMMGDHVVRNNLFAGSSAGSRLQYGAGTTGSSSAVPTLGATGPFRVGSTVRVRLRGGIGGGFAAIRASFQPANQPVPGFPGLTRYLHQSFDLATVVLDGPTDVAGEGAADLFLTIPNWMQGLPFYMQAYVLEPNTSPLTVSQTCGVAVHVGG